MASGMILTMAGRILLAKALTGKPLVFTRAYCGDGVLKSGQDQTLLTKLISPKKELPIQSMNTLQGIGTCEVVVEMTNAGMSSGFFVREYGLFALDPDNKSEVLYSYRNTGDKSGYLEGDSGSDKISYTVSIVTVIDQAPNVSAVLTNTNQYVTYTKLDSKIDSLFGGYAALSGFWGFSGEGHVFRPASLDQTKRALWGDADISGFNSRIERLEDAVNETMLKLEMLSEYPGYSHFVAEDFKDVNQIDQFAGKITSIVAGDDSIDVEPVDGMLPGSMYLITDGVNTEQVQVESISLENGIQRVILKEPIKHTYLNGIVQIFRTSVKIQSSSEGGRASGSDVRLMMNWQPNTEWKGTSENEDFIVPVQTTINNQKAFVMMNDVTLNSAGFATLN